MQRCSIFPYNTYFNTVKAQLGEADFTIAWEEGCALPLEQVIAYALGELSFQDIRNTRA